MKKALKTKKVLKAKYPQEQFDLFEAHGETIKTKVNDVEFTISGSPEAIDLVREMFEK